MRTGPDIARIAALVGDPARAGMLTALMDGRALTATELAAEAGVTPQTASSHLAQLADGGLLVRRKQGRHRYFALSGPEIAGLLESLMSLSAGVLAPRTRTGPRDAALRDARVCYNHLAGRMGVQMLDSLRARGFVTGAEAGLALTDSGEAFVTDLGIDLATLRRGRAPLCRDCLDWSERRSHLAGSLGRALFARIEDLGWARREAGSRAVRFTPPGLRAFDLAFPPQAAIR